MQTELCINELKYKMFLPFKDTDTIQRHIYMTKSPYELDLPQHMLAKLKDEKINELLKSNAEELMKFSNAIELIQ